MSKLIKPCQVEGLQDIKSDLEQISEAYISDSELLQEVKGKIDSILGEGSSDAINLPELMRLSTQLNAEFNGGTYKDSRGNSFTVDGLKNKKIQDIAKGEYVLGNGLTGNRVTEIDSSKFLKSQVLRPYTLDNMPITDNSGNPITVSFNSDYSAATYSSAPFVIDLDESRNTGEVTYAPYPGHFKVFLVGEWTLEQLPETALLDNNEMQLIAYDQALQKIVIQLAQDKTLIDEVVASVGEITVADAISNAISPINSRIKTLENSAYFWHNIVPDDGMAITDFVVRSTFDPVTGETLDTSGDIILVDERTEEDLNQNVEVLSAARARNEISALAEKIAIEESSLRTEFVNRIKYNSDVNLRAAQARINLLSAHKGDVVAPAEFGQPAIVADADGVLTQLQQGGLTANNIKVSDGIDTQIKDNDTILQDVVAAESAFNLLSSYIPSVQYVDDNIKIAMANAEKSLRSIHRALDNRIDSIESSVNVVEHLIPNGETIVLSHVPSAPEELELIVNGLIYYSVNGYFTVSENIISWDETKATFSLGDVCASGDKITVKYKWIDLNKVTPV